MLNKSLHRKIYLHAQYLEHRLASNFIFYTFIIRCLHNDFIANLLNNQAVALFKKQPN
ncbi:hypothetical protein EC5412_1782 [Escherichia coli 5412]|uniref:Uncharacterized protein n=1 Tax=Escherichia coli 1-250-04_S3_C1 TaxID=1444135 RepID=A0AAN4NXB9_ECOLX|nr:hypothetical protein G2583_1419 [Escherichia coli O55:H7 str. CB9615]EGX08023.1 hypothetical protein ECSTECMHI813_1180 [Escherichia coli STEC_MHI813]EHV28256.1 hypothetical protein ECDEC5A_1287 [Escherichia coli DEC5A]EHV41130.1 hypothetical protein ECDEC5C_1562 [Escherichia coli DEC5C]EHV42835.1 hypothetical protein ECDEC5D_1737 [Escherichia coli DEC5D]EIO51569.1 hypothetical protein ECTW06591_1290 [Escherichia coli TW06591]EKI12904.1 hypothetical protein EC5412_1782 [Escherichia coli 541